MRRLLIANRGEIAVRIIRACRTMGISPVAVFSEADASALHVCLADEAVLLGPAAAAESYLSIPKLIQAAGQTGCDALHPGYGFLSERPELAEACANAGITFVGPPASVIHALGDKIASKAMVQAAGVPIVPGYFGEDQSLETLSAEAAHIGPPLLIKASAGGGGRGMRHVTDLSIFSTQLAEAQREAKAIFGDSRVLLERLVTNAHHVEVQIFGDTQGSVVHLFERDCSVQRRHQKVIEESPSPILTPELRERITAAAVTAARAALYVGAGTVEFLVERLPDGEHAYYFLEVNTRLQVEHPVTEMRTGRDLVRWQLSVADGEPLPCSQSEIDAIGHSIEARIYAEDCAHDFLPSVGAIRYWREPTGPGIRVDSGVTAGDQSLPYYDAMLAKVIAHGENRTHALSRLEHALTEFAVLGIDTNIPYLLAIIRDPIFKAGAATTGFIAERMANWTPDNHLDRDVLMALAAARGSTPPRSMGIAPPTPWSSQSGWRNG